MRPAYQIALASESLALIGEICAIQGQIEWCMRVTVGNLLKVSADAARCIMGSTSVATNAAIWINILRERSPDPETGEFAELAYRRIETLAAGRNDFIHAVYGWSGIVYPTGVMEDFILRPDLDGIPRAEKGVAMRVRNHHIRDVDDLKIVRDEAAFVSVLAAHINWVTHDEDHWGDEPSPWRDILAQPHPPSPRKPAPRKATKHYTPPEKSAE